MIVSVVDKASAPRSILGRGVVVPIATTLGLCYNGVGRAALLSYGYHHDDRRTAPNYEQTTITPP